MFNFLKKDKNKYKYSYSFYLPSGIYNGIMGKHNAISPETIKSFLIDNYFDGEDIKIDIQIIREYLYLITADFQEKEKQVHFLTFIEQYKELFPPWKAFPDLFQGAPRWNQGTQYDYCIDNWMPYWKTLTDIEKEEHFDKYDCPAEWREWLKEFEHHF